MKALEGLLATERDNIKAALKKQKQPAVVTEEVSEDSEANVRDEEDSEDKEDSEPVGSSVFELDETDIKKSKAMVHSEKVLKEGVFDIDGSTSNPKQKTEVYRVMGSSKLLS